MTKPVVLLIDDDSADLYASERMLRDAPSVGAIFMATGGEAAFEFLAERVAEGTSWPRLILLDLWMPRMDGFQFLETFESLYRHRPTKIAIMSGSDFGPARERALRYASVIDYFKKPVRLSSVEAHLSKGGNAGPYVGSGSHVDP